MLSNNIPVNLIRQWCFCPRVVYYMELTNHTVIRPTWVHQGTDFHSAEEQLWQRRDLSRFNLKVGTRHHNLSVNDDALAMHGIVDMAIETDEYVYATEFKLSAFNKRRGDILQLAAYAMLLEKHFNKPSPVGFLLGKGKVLHSVPIDDKHRRDVSKTVREIQKMLNRGIKPQSNATVAQCCNCEYINHCNDRL